MAGLLPARSLHEDEAQRKLSLVGQDHFGLVVTLASRSLFSLRDARANPTVSQVRIFRNVFLLLDNMGEVDGMADSLLSAGDRYVCYHKTTGADGTAVLDCDQVRTD